MNLKKSDKMIAIVGVAILIIAAIGVILYVPENGESPAPDIDGEEKTYMIKVTPKEEEESPQTYTLQLARQFGRLDYKTTGKMDLFTLNKDNVENIIFEVKYTDLQNSFPILSTILNLLGRSKLGIDELSITIIDPDEVKHVITLMGGKKNITIDVSNKITQETIIGKSEDEAKMALANLTAENSKWNGQMFQISGQLTINGKLGILARIRERFGIDQFTVTINYNYYKYELGDEVEEEEEEPPMGQNTETSYATPWASMSLGGFL